jgi:hypothetical protein
LGALEVQDRQLGREGIGVLLAVPAGALGVIASACSSVRGFHGRCEVRLCDAGSRVAVPIRKA